ncbi:unnamed protein product (macronuclear) [Paramecium tetraurelia]|uniref:Transmembrane protein n=1 Tax=Paramecium tetraurelia TaxID=5888 RepID=A0CUM3_PARTE|nr:uncharacterized protein GSPATT00010690001 [Paramecium tetraurelia]CAK74490.1 unnamed protein product [Paramecium tetraurelia]|eukprot:XP_001441887.1 hypothetical protein (macronuclear) [Paramecium tetraurelia strain d4-2]
MQQRKIYCFGIYPLLQFLQNFLLHFLSLFNYFQSIFNKVLLDFFNIILHKIYLQINYFHFLFFQSFYNHIFLNQAQNDIETIKKHTFYDFLHSFPPIPNQQLQLSLIACSLEKINFLYYYSLIILLFGILLSMCFHILKQLQQEKFNLPIRIIQNLVFDICFFIYLLNLFLNQIIMNSPLFYFYTFLQGDCLRSRIRHFFQFVISSEKCLLLNLLWIENLLSSQTFFFFTVLIKYLDTKTIYQ